MHLILTPSRNENASMKTDEINIAEVTSEKQDIETALPVYDILSYPADFTLEVLVDKLSNGEIRVPPLQRRFIWPIERASKLIESFLLGLPVPPVFLYQDNLNTLLIVDGQQRLRSMAYFFSGYFGDAKDPEKVPFKLTGLSPHSPFSNLDIDELKKPHHAATLKRLKSSVMRAFIMKQLSPKDDTSIIEVFERLNTGGIIAQGQEIRNCIYEGDFNELLKELNKNGNWRKIMGKTIVDRRMRDVELLLRFLALYYNIRHYQKPMKVFLNQFMKTHRKMPPQVADDAPDAEKKANASKRKEFARIMDEFSNIFTQTAAAVVKYLGEKPFHISRGLNAAVFDSVFTAFALNLVKLKSGNRTRKQMQSRFIELLRNRKYEAYITSATTDEDVVPKRLKQAAAVLFS